MPELTRNGPMACAIRVEGLGKEYRIGALRHPGGLLVDQLAGALNHPLRALRGVFALDATERFWAIKDLDFEIQQGDVLGVVGRNGAGKSTLLKILSRITDPSQGRAFVRGRIASLLEVGTGFHPELSGRENIYLNATILGMSRREIVRKFDEIVAFSGVERFLDTPVKHYSSGMYVRLAFGVAAHVDADILIVDEVLAVGDAEFQRRCLGKMGEVARDGRTLVFVSHNLTALRNLCTKGLLLDGGLASTIGPIGDVLAKYGTLSRPALGVRTTGEPVVRAGPAVVSKVDVISKVNPDSGRISISRPFVIHVELDIAQRDEIGVFLHCHDAQREMVFSTGSFFDRDLNGLVLAPGLNIFECEVPGHLLNDGEYTLDVMLVRRRHEVVVSETSIVAFQVHDDCPVVEGWHWRPIGAVRPPLTWRYQGDDVDSGA